MEPGQAAQFNLEVFANGKGTVIVNGNDISNLVLAAALYCRPGEPTRLVLHLLGGGQVFGEGIVEVVPPSQVDGNLIRRINPQEIEEEALRRMSWGNDATLAETMLTVIAEKLDEAQS